MDSETNHGEIDRVATFWLVYPAVDAALPQEIVTLTSQFSRRTGSYAATAVRTWVSDLDGSGLEEDRMDPVEILSMPPHPEVSLEDFHNMAVQELEERRRSDFDVADLFVKDP